MDRVTLDYRGYLMFTGWSEGHYAKQIQSNRRAKLSKMGTQVVASTGKGKNASYVVDIPSGFWSMLLIPSMNYTAVGAEYINMLVEGRDKLHTDNGTIVKFNNEIYEELAEDYNADLEAVKATCKRIRNYLIDHGYIQRDLVHCEKTHRVKQQKNEGWTTGSAAIEYDKRARSIWYSFFQEKLSMYKEINPTATEVPLYIVGKELRELYSFGMKERLEVDYYRVAKKTNISDKLVSDLAYARHSFLKTLNLSQVREELAERQASYKIKKSLDDENVLKLIKENTQPSQEEIAAEREAMNLIELKRETKWEPPTEEQKEKTRRAVEMAMSLNWDD